MIDLNFHPFPILTTERLVLRQLLNEDENEIYFLRSDETINKYLDRPKAESIEDARSFIKKINDGIAKNETIYWAISLSGNSKLIGTICLWNISKEACKAELGYELLPEYQGKGIMQEAITMVLRYGFNIMQLQTIEAEVDTGNISSIKLLEKNKFKLPGIDIDIEDGKTVVYELHKSEYV